MKKYKIEFGRLTVTDKQESDEGATVWNLDFESAKKMLSMFEDMPEEIRAQVESGKAE